MRCSSTLAQLLHENLAQHNIVVVFEDCAEHNRHTIGFRLHVERLLIAIIDHRKLFTLEAFLLKVEILFEYARETVTLEHANLLSEFFIVLGNVLEIDEHRNVEAIFGVDKEIAVFAL